MASELVIALGQALSRCAAVDLSVLSPVDVASMVVDLRRVASRLEAEIARAVHAASVAEAWQASGATSVDAWLANETQVSMRSARDQVRLADTLAAAPMVAEKMVEGSLSVDNARLLGSVVGDERFADDADLLVEIAAGSPRDTRRALEQWMAMSDPAGEAEREEQLRLKRHPSFTPNGDGMVDVKGLLMPVDVAHVRAALEHIAGAACADETGRPHHTRIADALVELCQAYNSWTVTGGRERPKVMMVVPFETRDGGCRWPGCDRPPGWCEAHHFKEVVKDDGPTDLDQMGLFCSAHHHYLHQPGWQLIGDTHDLAVRKPDGTLMPAPCRGPAFTHPQQLQLVDS